jgi:hypothetical protein
MSGYLRQGQPNTPCVIQFTSEREIASVFAASDPFHLDDPCPTTGMTHFPIRSAGDVVCAHCGNIFMRRHWGF